MNNFLPKEIAWQKKIKIGYEPPQKQWMENKLLQDMIMDGRTKLVQQNVLHKKVLKQTVQAKAAHDANNYDWRYLSAASLFAS